MVWSPHHLQNGNKIISTQFHFLIIDVHSLIVGLYRFGLLCNDTCSTVSSLLHLIINLMKRMNLVLTKDFQTARFLPASWMRVKVGSSFNDVNFQMEEFYCMGHRLKNPILGETWFTMKLLVNMCTKVKTANLENYLKYECMKITRTTWNNCWADLLW